MEDEAGLGLLTDLNMEMLGVQLVRGNIGSNTTGKVYRSWIKFLISNNIDFQLPMVSQATAKFQGLHPTYHKLMLHMINQARRRKGCPLCEREVRKEEVNTQHTEMINMMKNLNLVQFRDEDKLREKRSNSKLKNKKRISWRENLTEISSKI